MKARKARPVIAALSIALSVGLAPAGLSPTLAHAAGPVISGTVTLPTYVSSGSDAVPTQWTDQPAEWLVAPTDDSSIWSVEYDNACSTWSGDPVDDMGSVNLKSGGTFSFEPNAEAISAASTNCYQLMVYNSVSETYMVFKLGAGDPASVGYITPGSDGSLSGVALDASSVAAPATLTTVSGNISGSGYNFTGWKVIYQPASCDNVQKTFGTSSFANVNGSTVGSGTFTVDVSSNYCYNIQFRDNAGEEENVKHTSSNKYTPYLLTAGSNDLAFTRPATSDLTLNLSGLNTKHSYVLEISAYSSTPDGVSAEAVKTVDIEGNDASATVHVLSGMQYSVRLLDSNTRLYAPITITGGTPTPRNTEAHAWQEVSGGQTVVVAANDKGQTISGTVTGLTAPDGFKVKISVSEAGSRVEQGYAAITEGAFEHKTWANMSYSISLVRSDPEGDTIIPFLVDDDDDPDNNSPDDLVNLQSVAAADAKNLVLWAQNPAPYYEPKLTGYTEFGMVLTVDAVPEGYTATYTWYRVDSIDETDHTLLQSGSDKTSYTIVLGDVSHQIEVIVENITCSDTSCQGFADIENKSVLSDEVSGATEPDVSMIKVKLDPNDLKVDTEVTPDFGEHDEYEEWASCVWKAAGTTISTSGCTYAPTADDLGKELTVDVTITKPNGGTDTAPTITVGTVKKADKIATDEWKVEISNLEPLVGDTVTAEISSGADGWTPAYQWKLTDKNGNTTNISGATSASYKITSANVGKTLTVEVKLTRAGYETPEPNVSPGVELKSTFDNFTPAISGSVLLGSALSVTGLPSASTYPNTTPLYSWKVAGIEVGTEATYTIAEADLGKSITVTVTMAGQGYTSKSATSAVLAIDNGSIAAFTPVLTGIAKVDSVLVVTGIPDVYSPANGYAVTYQWLRNGTAISKAITSTYRLNSSDLGAAVSVRVTLNKSGYDQLVVVSGALTVEKADEKASDPEVPAGTVTPVITAGAAGDTITPGDKVTAGEIPEGYTATYQWQRDGKQISGATKSSYTLVNGDQGHTLTVVVTLSKDGYSDTAFASAGVTVLEKTAVFTPKITGTAKVGKTLTATGAPSGWTVKYQWLRDGKKISKATKSTYKVVSADSGHKLTVRMTATKSGYTKTVKTSAVKSQAKLKATLTLKIPTAKANKSAKVTITVTAPGIKKPNGKVSVKVNGVTKTVNVKKGKATFKTPKLKKGSYKITVKWMSNAEIKSASKKGTLKVK